MTEITLKKPTLREAPGIVRLIRHYAERQFLLPRTLAQVHERLRDFVVCEDGDEVVACGALHLWSDLAEIRSLAVAEHRWRKGLGSAIVTACLNEARALGVKRVFVLTYQPEFFERMGFQRADKDKFPQKIWVDCANCPRFPNCTETALVVDIEAPSAPATQSQE